jgi:hypothetical protein
VSPDRDVLGTVVSLVAVEVARFYAGLKQRITEFLVCHQAMGWNVHGVPGAEAMVTRFVIPPGQQHSSNAYDRSVFERAVSHTIGDDFSSHEAILA